MREQGNLSAAHNAAASIIARYHQDRCLAKARALIGVPWKHQGRHPVVGIDCVGLLVLALGITDIPIPDYSRDPSDGQLEMALEQYLGPPLPVDAQWLPGDVAAMAYGRVIRHCGLLADHVYGGLSLIHTDSQLGRVTEHPLDAKWQRRVRLVYRGVPL